MRRPSEVVRRVLQTEKGARVEAYGQYLLQVDPSADKTQIRHAVEALFNVRVIKVNTQNGRGKWRRLSVRWGRRPDWKKAFVTLEKGQKIEVKT